MPASERIPRGPSWLRGTGATADALPSRTPAAHRRAGRVWRDNVEAMAMAIVMALVLKYFMIEAYKIPTGSMQPTLMGDDRTGVFDRILVDKLSYRFRDPERFDVVVFRYPLDRSKNFVKRIVGMPGEELRIDHGDLWVRAAGGGPWRVLRRPRAAQTATWKTIDPATAADAPWRLPANGDWTAGTRWLRARGDGRARYASVVRDVYTHGYPEVLRPEILARRGNSGRNDVGDLRLEGTVRALAGTAGVSLELTEGGRRYTFTLPGPAARDEDAAPSIVVSGEDRTAGFEPGRVVYERPWRLRAGETVAFGVQNLDDLLELEVDGDALLSFEVPFARDQRSGASIAVDGEGADFDRLELKRDIYYLAGQARDTVIPDGSYFMLGDNTQDSSDSREWTFVRFALDPPDPAEPASDGDPTAARGERRIVRGNHRQAENPRYLPGPGGTEVLLDDEWGERHRFPLADARKLPPEPAPFVSRDLILGRALCVFWPVKPWRDIVRTKWVR